MKKSIRYISAFLLFVLSVSLFVGCEKEAGESETLLTEPLSFPKGVESVEYKSKLLYKGENDLQGFSQTADSLWVIDNGQKVKVEADLAISAAKPLSEGEAAGPAVTTESGTYVLHPLDGVTRDGVPLSLPEDGYYTPLGFWQINGTSYLTAVKTVYDSEVIDLPVSQELFLFPLGKKLGDPILVEGITPDLYPMAHGEGWNYWIAKGVLFRSNGQNTQKLGTLTTFGVSSLFDMAIMGDAVLLLSENKLIALTPKETQADEEGETIIMGVEATQFHLMDIVAQYNLASGNRIEMKKFDDFNQLNLAVLSGEVDMVASANGDRLTNYARQGYLKPMEEVIGDLLASGDFYPNVLDALNYRGKTYLMTDSFKVYGMSLPKSVVDQTGEPQSMGELVEILDSLNDQSFYKRVTKEFAFRHFLMNGISAWVDLENYTCDFVNEDFLTLLHLADRYATDQAEVDANRNEYNKKLFNTFCAIHHARSVNLALEFEIKGTEKPYSSYGLEAAMVPCPTQPGYGFAIVPNVLFGILESSERKDAAEDFLRWLLSPEIQEYTLEYSCKQGSCGVPITKQVLENAVTSYLVENNNSYAEYNYAILLDAIDRADHMNSNYYNQISNIVEEEAAIFFSGDKDAEITAEHIQSRVSLYLAEQS
ncbi:MAG: carbohydrate ABC transporter substrate-binding protein [Clostridia bacterium]|nr:carbohydrate ABC transporter substrate-binding protein [Clostridia bacterium]